MEFGSHRWQGKGPGRKIAHTVMVDTYTWASTCAALRLSDALAGKELLGCGFPGQHLIAGFS